MELREWAAGDQPAVDALLDSTTSDLFAIQAHPLHGPDRDGERWRRTRLACMADGSVVGAGTIVRNRLHGGRCTLAIETAAAHRRSGIARTLLGRLLELRPERIPLAAKVPVDDDAAVGFARALGFRAYQHCPGLVPDPTDADVRAWAGQVAVPVGCEVVPLAACLHGVLVDVFADLYRWIHTDWSPVTCESTLRDVATDAVGDADHVRSRAVLRGGRIAAVSWIFVEEGEYELMTETTRRDEPDGVAMVRAALAASMLALGDAGARAVDIDGHVDDPHLSSVLAELPPCRSEPFDLVELQ